MEGLDKIVPSIIRMRKFLIKTNRSKTNDLKSHKYINQLNLYIEAYGHKWNDHGWHRFVSQHINEIEYLIPENKSGNSLKNKLHEKIHNFHPST
jgi:hypothetical protein